MLKLNYERLRQHFRAPLEHSGLLLADLDFFDQELFSAALRDLLVGGGLPHKGS